MNKKDFMNYTTLYKYSYLDKKTNKEYNTARTNSPPHREDRNPILIDKNIQLLSYTSCPCYVNSLGVIDHDSQVKAREMNDHGLIYCIY